ncbi:MAG TPA: hypothetical protein VJM12_02570 [Pyrinomonadaceae bacterium]|nr:hypothetical protein [Pyrinomonadaceae bacterium]
MMITTARAQSPCKVGAQAPPVGFSTWAPGSKIKVYVLEKEFADDELPFLLTALDTWNAVSDLTGSKVRFEYKGTTASQLYCENCLTIRRGSVFDKSHRRLATLRASTGTRNQIITWANITIDPQLTNPRTLTNAVAHELGHSFGLLDCYSCAARSTVMIKFGDVNVSNEMDRPSGCDVEQVKAVYRSLAQLTPVRSPRAMVVDEGQEPVEDDTPVVIPKP